MKSDDDALVKGLLDRAESIKSRSSVTKEDIDSLINDLNTIGKVSEANRTKLLEAVQKLIDVVKENVSRKQFIVIRRVLNQKGLLSETEQVKLKTDKKYQKFDEIYEGFDKKQQEWFDEFSDILNADSELTPEEKIDFGKKTRGLISDYNKLADGAIKAEDDKEQLSKDINKLQVKLDKDLLPEKRDYYEEKLDQKIDQLDKAEDVITKYDEVTETLSKNLEKTVKNIKESGLKCNKEFLKKKVTKLQEGFNQARSRVGRVRKNHLDAKQNLKDNVGNIKSEMQKKSKNKPIVTDDRKRKISKKVANRKKGRGV